jgi:two-component system OmpR family sensor kinase
MTLRRRILLGLMLLVGAGLVVTDVALWVGLRTYLYDQVDTQLTSLVNSPVVNFTCGGNFDRGGGSPSPGLPSNSYVAFFTDSGQQLCGGFVDPHVSTSAQPPSLPVLYGTGAGAAAFGTPFERAAVSGGAGYLVLAVAGTGEEGGTIVPGSLVVAIPTAGASSTLDRLRLIEVVTSIAILVTLAIGAWSMVRVGLRPLDEMTRAAGDIAGGDLSRRVPAGDPRTEVGRLGSAMNTMLAQIESAFAARERSESRLRRFVADASHELRTPLTSIRGYAELFRRGAASRPEDLATAMRRIEEEAVRMSVLVDDLLHLARLDIAAAERRAPVRNPVDLARVAADAVGDLRAVEPERTVTLEAGPAVALGDDAALRQVVANLLANTRHHTPATTPVLVRTGTAPDAGHVFIEVTDQGPGMTPEDASHVFERFWRADPARTRGHGGAGLGLSIVAAIVDAHGGTVGVDAAPGAGSSFRVQLPVVPDGAVDGALPPPATVPPRPPAIAGRPGPVSVTPPETATAGLTASAAAAPAAVPPGATAAAWAATSAGDGPTTGTGTA